MSKINITRNCLNGEHTFIAGNTYIDGRDHIVTNWVCQHCLMLVSEKEWLDHLQSMTEPPKKISTITPKKDEVNNESKLSYHGKKRGPKPKSGSLEEKE